MSNEIDDFFKSYAQTILAEVERRNPRTDGYVSKALVNEVMVKASEELKAATNESLRAHYPDPADQRALGIWFDNMFIEFERQVEEKWIVS
jgi:hypothetical protein